MIYNEDAYYTGYYRNVRALKAVPALVFDTIVGLLRDPKNTTGEIAIKTLCDMMGVSKNTIKEAVDKLIKEDYITVIKGGDGRGDKSVFILTNKGSKNAPFLEKKGVRNSSERGQKSTDKGSEIDHINKELNKELKEREVSPTPAKIVMEDFLLFCELYPVDPVWSHEKEACERVWSVMDAALREKLIEQLKRGLRWRVRDNDNPYWYLKDFAGQDVKTELPYMKQGTETFHKWLLQNQSEGKKIVLMHYQEGDDMRLIYVLEDDRKTMERAGAKYLRDF